MDWQKLAEKSTRGILAVEYYFSPQSIREARMIMTSAEDRIHKNAKSEKPELIVREM
jgi:hypothetical protein